jgi:TPR repeat protein
MFARLKIVLELWREIMKRGWKYLWCLIAVMGLVSVPAGAADVDAGQKKPLTMKEMGKMSSAQLIERTDATAEEDYEAGLIAYGRQEFVEAQGLFERAAKKGNIKALGKYAEILNRAGFVNEAAAAYLQAANRGDADAQFSLAAMYMDLNSYDLKDITAKARPAEARKWLLKAAEQGHAGAIGLLVDAYVHGGLGLTDAERSDAVVLEWINKGADINNATALTALADAYKNGKYGLPIDLKQADEWGEKAKAAIGMAEKKKVEKPKRKRRL